MSDPMFVGLVAWAEVGLCVGVTVVLDGQIVSGELYSAREYFDDVKDRFRSGLKDVKIDVQKAVQNGFEEFYEMYSDLPPGSQRSHFYMRNVKFLSGGAPYPNTDKLQMCGLISNVSAVIFGEIKKQ